MKIFPLASIFSESENDFPHGKITSGGRPEDVPKRRAMDIPYGPLFNTNRRPLLTSQGSLLWASLDVEI